MWLRSVFNWFLEVCPDSKGNVCRHLSILSIEKLPLPYFHTLSQWVPLSVLKKAKDIIFYQGQVLSLRIIYFIPPNSNLTSIVCFYVRIFQSRLMCNNAERLIIYDEWSKIPGWKFHIILACGCWRTNILYIIVFFFNIA